MDCRSISFSSHAVARMFERAISRDDVMAVLKAGMVIADYPDDAPYPSRLMLGFPNGRPVHVVAAQNIVEGACYIVTAYVPSEKLWTDDFQTRR